MFFLGRPLKAPQVRKVLEAVQGNKTLAAKVLGFDRRTLYRKLKHYGMPGDAV